MIIRSQDKKGIVVLENVDTIWVVDANLVAYNGTIDSSTVIARYSTEQKAIKVLDMICNRACTEHYEKVVPEQCETIYGIVFDAPQDDEVEE